MASPTRWTWVWVNSGSWWWTGRPVVLRFMGLQRAGHDWATELNWTAHYSPFLLKCRPAHGACTQTHSFSHLFTFVRVLVSILWNIKVDEGKFCLIHFSFILVPGDQYHWLFLAGQDILFLQPFPKACTVLHHHHQLTYPESLVLQYNYLLKIIRSSIPNMGTPGWWYYNETSLSVTLSTLTKDKAGLSQNYKKKKNNKTSI